MGKAGTYGTLMILSVLFSLLFERLIRPRSYTFTFLFQHLHGVGVSVLDRAPESCYVTLSRSYILTLWLVLHFLPEGTAGRTDAL